MNRLLLAIIATVQLTACSSATFYPSGTDTYVQACMRNQRGFDNLPQARQDFAAYAGTDGWESHIIATVTDDTLDPLDGNMQDAETAPLVFEGTVAVVQCLQMPGTATFVYIH